MDIEKLIFAALFVLLVHGSSATAEESSTATQPTRLTCMNTHHDTYRVCGVYLPAPWGQTKSHFWADNYSVLSKIYVSKEMFYFAFDLAYVAIHGAEYPGDRHLPIGRWFIPITVASIAHGDTSVTNSVSNIQAGVDEVRDGVAALSALLGERSEQELQTLQKLVEQGSAKTQSELILTEAQTTLTRLFQENDELRDENADMRVQVEVLSAELATVSHDLARAQQYNDTLRQKRDTQQAELTKVRVEAARTEGTAPVITLLERELVAAQEQYASAQTEIGELRVELQSAESIVAQTQALLERKTATWQANADALRAEKESSDALQKNMSLQNAKLQTVLIEQEETKNAERADQTTFVRMLVVTFLTMLLFIIAIGIALVTRHKKDESTK